MDLDKFKNFGQFFGWMKASPAGIFIHTILFKWYLIIAVPAVYIGYHFLKGLENTGILKRVEDHLTSYLETLVKVSENCTPLILNIYDFYDCLGRY
ncbi:MAG: DUF2670 domain-containing protein [Alphaproteobacteria bacterium]|nr:DUF2670 domain-containing protein [Alphaproteobacteria bacterium]OJV11936.1 MAG: hypothetical protein BGO27_00520 [Alphaproteobacteria bacterium 33-17]